MKKVLSLALLSIIGLEASSLSEAFSKSEMNGQLRLGAIQTKDSAGDRSSTLALGGSLGVKTAPVAGISLAATFYTTNALFGKNNEGMFLDSNSESYSIVGEAYIQAELGKTTLKAGRHIVDTPYADSDDIGMVPNTFEGITLINQDIPNTTVMLAMLNRWSGVDTETPEKFNDIQASGDSIYIGALIYEGLENTTLQAWQYKLDDTDFNYLEAVYETEAYSVATQYIDQGHDNTAFGFSGAVNMGNLAFNAAYNKAYGTVTNGFGGGPFFTSSEDHTVAEVVDQEAILIGAEYAINDLTVALTHVAFDKGEDETDYLLSYAVNDNHSLDLIYSDMYNDGTMVRFFANYNF